jgi:hypothetical protein
MLEYRDGHRFQLCTCGKNQMVAVSQLRKALGYRSHFRQLRALLKYLLELYEFRRQWLR